jgi:hypothetical protein
MMIEGGRVEGGEGGTWTGGLCGEGSGVGKM